MQLIATASGTNTATMPAHQAGDLLVVHAFRDGNTNPPTNVTNWTSRRTGTGTSSSMRVSTRLATSSSHATGTWTNATSVIVEVWRPEAGCTLSTGATGGTNGSGNTITVSGLTLQGTNGRSFVTYGVGSTGSSSATSIAAPAGMAQSRVVADTTDTLVSFATTAGVDSFGGRTATATGTSSNWITNGLEIRETDPPEDLTAELDATETGNDTAAIAARVSITAALAAGGGSSDVAALSASVRITAVLEAQESGGDAFAANVLTAVPMAIAATESGQDAADISVLTALPVTVAATESAPDSASIAAAVSIRAQIAATDTSDTAAASVQVRVSAALEAGEDGDDTATIGASITIGLSFALTEEAGADSATAEARLQVNASVAIVEDGRDEAHITLLAAESVVIDATEAGIDTASVTLLMGANAYLQATEEGVDSTHVEARLSISAQLAAIEQADTAQIEISEGIVSAFSLVLPASPIRQGEPIEANLIAPETKRAAMPAYSAGASVRNPTTIGAKVQ